jgi:hypothetical protein
MLNYEVAAAAYIIVERSSIAVVAKSVLAHVVLREDERHTRNGKHGARVWRMHYDGVARWHSPAHHDIRATTAVSDIDILGGAGLAELHQACVELCDRDFAVTGAVFMAQGQDLAVVAAVVASVAALTGVHDLVAAARSFDLAHHAFTAAITDTVASGLFIRAGYRASTTGRG